VRHYSLLGCFLLNYVVISDLIYVLLCLTVNVRLCYVSLALDICSVLYVGSFL